MKRIRQFLSSFLVVGLLGAGLVVQAGAATGSAARHDAAIQTRAVQELGKKQEFRNVQAATEDGIVTLSGTVDLYQQKLDATKKVKKVSNVQGVRNLIEVAGKDVPDAALAAQLERKIYFDRVGYFDAPFNYVDVSVKDGVATLQGATRSDVGT